MRCSRLLELVTLLMTKYNARTPPELLTIIQTKCHTTEWYLPVSAMQKRIQRECQCECEFKTAFNTSPAPAPAPQPVLQSASHVGCLQNIPWCPILFKNTGIQTPATCLGKKGYFGLITALAAHRNKLKWEARKNDHPLSLKMTF